jgi:hypothetical protein
MGLSPVKPDTGLPAESKHSEAPSRIVKESTYQDIPLKNAFIKNSGGIGALLKQALFSLGLNQDSLNKALFIFTRYFSLPTGMSGNRSGLLTELRREVLNTAQSASAGEAAEGETDFSQKTENRALAATALADKGVKLNSNVLETYAQALDPDGKRFSENSENGKNGSDKDESNQNDSDDRRANREKAPVQEELRALFDEFMKLPGLDSGSLDGEKGILSFLNRIPGKNGQRWIVWPFNITVQGVRLRVLARFFIKEPASAAAGGRLFVNISGPLNSWRFILDKSGGRTLKAVISVYPERQPSSLNAVKREAEKFLAVLGPIEIEVNNGGKFPSLADFLEKEVTLSVHEVF